MPDFDTTGIRIVIPVRDVCTEYDDECLKFTLRSIEMYGTGQGEKVVILGKRRDWFSDKIVVCNVIEKGTNIYARSNQKVVEFCKINEPFILMNDDMILTSTYAFNYMKYYVDGNLRDRLISIEDKRYLAMVMNTVAFMQIRMSDPNFLTHTPFPVMYPEEVVKVMTLRNGRVMGVSFRQVYGSKFAVKSVKNNEWQARIINQPDLKIRSAKDIPGVLTLKPVISLNPHFYTTELKEMLNKVYCKKSIYEK